MQNLAWEGEVINFNKESWSTNGRVMAFRPVYNSNLEVDESVTVETTYGLQSDGSYNIYMLTNSSYNKDVVRVSSNNSMSPHAFKYPRNSDIAYDHNYDGNEYRSVIFDVAHYRPFRFAAQVKVSDGDVITTIPAVGELLSNEEHQSQEENVDNVEFSYKPGQQVDILFDVTSFKGSDGRSVHPFGETFGTEFEIYIDAPMLEIDESRLPDNWKAANNSKLTKDKLRKHPTIPGRFVYTVSQKRIDERTFGSAEAHNKDAATSRYDDFGGVQPGVTINQTGERKCLPFKKTAITAGGDIVISSETEKVVFWEKRFSVDTRHIQGNILYKKGNEEKSIPHNAFVAFVRLRTGARIGVVSITDNGKFELNLRDEYQFNWNDDPIDLYYTVDGVTYNFNYMEDGKAKSVDLELLYNLVSGGTPIVLTQKAE